MMFVFATEHAIIHFHLMSDEMIAALGALHGLTGDRQSVLDSLRRNVLHISTYEQLAVIFAAFQTIAVAHGKPEAVEFNGTA